MGKCVHTNDIEILWCDAKRKFKEMNGCSLKSNIPSYLDEWIWKRKFGDDERFDACVAAIRRSPLPTDGKQNTTMLSSRNVEIVSLLQIDILILCATRKFISGYRFSTYLIILITSSV